jgi:hypothetical protein
MVSFLGLELFFKIYGVPHGIPQRSNDIYCEIPVFLTIQVDRVLSLAPIGDFLYRLIRSWTELKTR